MNLTAEHFRIASRIDAKLQELVCDGNDDITILAEMFDYIPGFQRLMDTLESDTMDELCRRFAGFFHGANPTFSTRGVSDQGSRSRWTSWLKGLAYSLSVSKSPIW